MGYDKHGFPVPNEHQHAGVSLWDYFAAQALVGLLSNPHTDPSTDSTNSTIGAAWRAADMMIMERAKWVP